MSHRKHDSSKSIFANFIEKNFSSKSTNFYTCHRIFSIFYTCHRIFLFYKTCHWKFLFYQTLHWIKKYLISYDPWYCLTDRSLNPWSWKLSFRPLFYRWSFRPLVLFYRWSFKPLQIYSNISSKGTVGTSPNSFHNKTIYSQMVVLARCAFSVYSLFTRIFMAPLLVT